MDVPHITAHGWVLAHRKHRPTTAPGRLSESPPVVAMAERLLELSVPDGLSGAGAGFISDDGRVIAGHADAGGVSRAVIWTCQW